MVLLPQPISKTMIDAANGTAGNALGLTSRPQLWFTINIGWNFASDDSAAYAILSNTLARIEALTKSRGLYDPFAFLNDAFSTQAVARSYGAANFARLQAISKTYDPKQMFQLQVPGGFKLV
jgi:Berberine and berberine like